MYEYSSERKGVQRLGLSRRGHACLQSIARGSQLFHLVSPEGIPWTLT